MSPSLLENRVPVVTQNVQHALLCEQYSLRAPRLPARLFITPPKRLQRLHLVYESQNSGNPDRSTGLHCFLRLCLFPPPLQHFPFHHYGKSNTAERDVKKMKTSFRTIKRHRQDGVFTVRQTFSSFFLLFPCPYWHIFSLNLLYSCIFVSLLISTTHFSSLSIILLFSFPPCHTLFITSTPFIMPPMSIFRTKAHLCNTFTIHSWKILIRTTSVHQTPRLVVRVYWQIMQIALMIWGN